MPAHLPSPTSTASLSPRQNSLGHAMARHSSCSDDEHDVHDDVHNSRDMAARSALEIRREKNRIKQRNLRLRRANQMADLESTVNTLRSKGHDLADRIAELEAREASLLAWVRDLEGALSSQGQGEHVDALRRMRAPSSYRDQRDRDIRDIRDRDRDPLATLASAASRRRWDDGDSQSKRRREDDLPPINRLPSPSRMRISDLVLPQPQPSLSNPRQLHQPQPWAWGHLPPSDFTFDQKSRGPHSAPASDERETRSDTHREREQHEPRHPRSTSPTSTSHASNSRWQSPVQSFELRL